jgi:hypothetical protein
MSIVFPEEVGYIKQECPNVRPPIFGQTIIAVPDGISGIELLQRVREVWSVVAQWGRCFDEECVGRPESGEAVRLLPGWFFSQWLTQRYALDLESWFYFLDIREWTWWSGACVGDRVKIDINAEGLPNELWALLVVVEMAGGSIAYEDMWIATDHKVCGGPNP